MNMEKLIRKAEREAAEARNQLGEREEYVALLRSMAALFPQLRFTRLTTDTSEGRLRVGLDAKNWPDVRSLLNVLPPLPAIKRRDSNRPFVPADRDEGVPVYPVWVRCLNLSFPEVVAEWYSQMPDESGTRLHVEAEVRNIRSLVHWTGRGGIDSMLHHHFQEAQAIGWVLPEVFHMGATFYWREGTEPDVVFGRSEVEHAYVEL